MCNLRAKKDIGVEGRLREKKKMSGGRNRRREWGNW
jgi:hypothetical protein